VHCILFLLFLLLYIKFDSLIGLTWPFSDDISWINLRYFQNHILTVGVNYFEKPFLYNSITLLNYAKRVHFDLAVSLNVMYFSTTVEGKAQTLISSSIKFIVPSTSTYSTSDLHHRYFLFSIHLLFIPLTLTNFDSCFQVQIQS